MSNAESPGSCDWTTRLPPEILAEIFLTSLANAGDSNSDMLSRNPPWLLSQVCGRWRVVALSTPELWYSLFPFADSPLPVSSILALASAHIERSNPLPLKLRVDSDWWFSNRPLLDLLLSPSQRARWGEVQILRAREDDARSQSILVALRSNTFTCLKTLQLENCDFTGEPSRIVFPMLTSLTLVSCCTPLLKTLSTPLLSRLEVEFTKLYRGNGHRTSASADLVAFIQKYASSLVRLTLNNSRIEDRDLAGLLEKLPILTDLDVSDTITEVSTLLSDALLHGLRSRTHGPCVLPQLHTLSIMFVALPASTTSLLLDVLESRCHASETCGPLRSVRLCPYASFKPQTTRRLKALAETGMNIAAFVLASGRWVQVELK
ncbi:hypothetical protein B0H16DRAFT_602867 [Mycena metata]|uniref:F-box domain-containing protein n=1 Tax=Mycena metata TaxID=1033252 RepID=A0AAD7K956_9AGAR|nr:hypothetical protein B0H16DRAFT_602867 [Mycena metata]